MTGPMLLNRHEMPTRIREAAFWAIAWLLHLTTVLAAPSLNFPVNSQVPPVARVSQPFSFTFAESTFTFSEDPISYSLLNEPSWLQFDPDTRTFFGNATTREVGPTKFDLVASDSSGSASSEVTLIVTDWGGPKQGEALLAQLSKAGPTSAPASLLLHPLEVFQSTFDQDIFSNTSAATTFYATSADNSPLPSWLQFNPTSLRFSGTSPPLMSPTAKSQQYGVRLIASDIAGFAEAVTAFQIVVSHQILAFSETSQTVELSQGQKFMTDPLRKDLTLDGMPVHSTPLASVTSNAPGWANLNTDQIFLSGTPPQGATSQSVLIQIADMHGDTANITIDLVVSSNQKNLFRTSLAPVNAIVGQDFHYTIESNSLWNSDVHVIADVSNASSWLTYDATSRTFSGSVPGELRPGAIIITLDATLGSLTEHSKLVVDVVRNLTSPTSSRPPQGLPTSTSHLYPDATLNPKSASRDSRPMLKIMLGVFLPLLFLFCLGCLVLYCCWRRRRHRRASRHASEQYISGPAIPSEPERMYAPAVQGSQQDEKTPAPRSPPRIELPWAPDSLKKSKERLSKSTTNLESTLVDSGWGNLVIRDPAKPARNSKRLEETHQESGGDSGDWTPFVRNISNNLNYSRKRTSFRPTQSKVQKASVSSRASKTLSGLSTMSIGLPVRLSGAGHGAGGPSPPGFRDVRRSCRNTFDSFASEDGMATPFDLDAFPEPPGSQKGAQEEQQEQTLKASVRLVPSSSRSGSLVDRRQKWVKDRARDRHERGSRFSHAWSSRGYSRARGLGSSGRSSSIAKSGSLDPDDLLSRRNTQCSWSQSSSIGAPIRPETWVRMKSPDSHLMLHPSNLRRALSTVSSGRFDSAESKSNSSWVDDLVEEEDEDGHRRWVAVDKQPQESVAVQSSGSKGGGGGEQSEQCSWGKSSRTGGLGALRANIQGVGAAAAAGERRWRLGDEQAKRPISVDEGELQRSQGSQRGNLAFL